MKKTGNENVPLSLWWGWVFGCTRVTSASADPLLALNLIGTTYAEGLRARARSTFHHAWEISRGELRMLI
jgi:hypothetical protein